ncbi:MAG: anaerobic ribonucleoside-triphosphate reductase activating protein [archaeon]|nr:anaerobic ribonucleoside-triphosphate reductase activating protein [archaeon]
MEIGTTLMSSIEYPKLMSSVVFLAKCPLRCPYCSNKELLENGEEQSLEEVISKLKNDIDFSDALVISGGEPLVQLNSTIKLLEYGKELELKTKVDTSGVYPEKLKELLETDLVDYIALDIKAPFNKYKKVIGLDIGNKVKESMNLVYNSNTYLECRTTYCETLLNEEDIIEIAKEIQCDSYTLQQFRNRSVLDPKLKDVESPNPKDMERIANHIKPYLPNTKINIKTTEFGQKTI